MWMVKSLIQVPARIGMGIIRLYQKTVSPDHGVFKARFPHGYCKFYPSCSEYGYQSLQKHGLIKGGAKTTWRILRCNPWTKGGVDVVK